MKTYIYGILAGIVLVVIGYVTYLRLEKQNEQANKAAEVLWDLVQKYDKEQQSYDSLLKVNEAKRLEDSTAFAKKDSLKTLEINRLKKKKVVLKPEIDIVLDSIPLLKQYVEIQDSIIVAQDQRYDSLYVQYVDDVDRLMHQVLLYEKKLESAQNANGILKEFVIDQSNENDKLKRRGKRIVAGVVIFEIARTFLGNR